MQKLITCKECGEEKPNHGHGVCHRCYMRIQMRERRRIFPETFKKLDKERWRGDRREKSNKKRMEAYYTNYEKEIKNRKIYRDKNSIKIYAQQKEYYEKNKDRIQQRNREYNKRRDKEKEFKRLYDWIKRQPIEKLRENWRASSQRRMAKKKLLPATLTKKEWDDIKDKFNHRCAYCGKESKLTQDHVIPLSRGGGYVKENIVPACISCNSKKGNKTAEEYMDYISK